jgi:hypothetical protein
MCALRHCLEVATSATCFTWLVFNYPITFQFCELKNYIWRYLHITSWTLNIVVKCLVLLLHMQKFHGPNVRLETSSHDWGVSWLSSALQVNDYNCCFSYPSQFIILESKCTRLWNKIMVMVHPVLLCQQLQNLLDNSCNSFSRSYHIQNILVFTTISPKMGHVTIYNN